MGYNYLSLGASFIRSFLFNIRYLGLKKGIKIPVFIAWNCKTNIAPNTIEVPEQVYFGMVKIGVNLGHFNRGNYEECFLKVGKEGRLIFKGKCNIAVGSAINISKGKVSIGDSVSTNDRFTLSSEKAITIEDGVLFGWNCTIIDGDGHSLINNKGEIVNEAKEVIIGNECWIASDSKIMKGVCLADYTTVAMGSIVTKSITEKNTILAGNPAKIVKRNVRWVGRRGENGF